MKKLFAVLAAMMMLLTTACSGSTQTSTSKSMTDSLSGTYVGKNGSALTLFPDGTSEYYYMLYSSMDEDKGAGEWSYKDGTLTWMYNDKPVTAAINEQSAFSFTLEQSDGWNREQYIKASDVAEKRSASEYQQIMRDTLKQPEMDNFDEKLNTTYQIEPFDFSIPFYWFVSQKDENSILFCSESTEDSLALLMAGTFDIGVDISNRDFEENGAILWRGAVDSIEGSSTIIQEPSKIEINGLPGVQGIIDINSDGYEFRDTAIILFDEKSDIALCLQLLAANTIFRYDSDYTKIINSVTVNKSIETSSSSSVSSGGGRTESSSVTMNTNGVTPELKEFLDSYEAYMNQYIAFMQKYENSDDAYAMLSDYLDMMQQYADFAEKLGQYDTDKMSAADSAYYLEVTTRVAKKLYAAAIQ